jgi:hypothetical protein
MSSPIIVDGVRFSTNDFKYSAPKMNASGGKSIGILNSGSNKALYIETPAMMQWGIKDWEGNEKFNMSLQFYNPEFEENEDQKRFLENMIAFENKLKADAVSNSKEWFGKPKMTSDMVEVLFSSKIKYPKDRNTGEPNGKPPTMDARVPFYEGTWRSEVYDTDGHCMFPCDDADVTPQSLIAKGSKVVTILQCGGIWFANGKFGVTWKLYQTVAKPYQSLKGKCHIKLSSKLDEQVNVDEVDDDTSVEAAVTNTVVEESDEEEEEEEEEVPSAPVVAVAPPSPPAPVKKKRVVKKVVKKSAPVAEA